MVRGTNKGTQHQLAASTADGLVMSTCGIGPPSRNDTSYRGLVVSFVSACKRIPRTDANHVWLASKNFVFVDRPLCT